MSETQARTPLSVVLGNHPHTRPLKDGTVPVDGVDCHYPEFAPLPAFARMVRELAYDICEMPMATYLQARDSRRAGDTAAGGPGRQHPPPVPDPVARGRGPRPQGTRRAARGCALLRPDHRPVGAGLAARGVRRRVLGRHVGDHRGRPRRPVPQPRQRGALGQRAGRRPAARRRCLGGGARPEGDRRAGSGTRPPRQGRGGRRTGVDRAARHGSGEPSAGGARRHPARPGGRSDRRVPGVEGRDRLDRGGARRLTGRTRGDGKLGDSLAACLEIAGQYALEQGLIGEPVDVAAIEEKAAFLAR